MALLYQEWLLDWVHQDNFAGHIMPNTLTNIHTENFEPNLTSHAQPNDQSIIHCFKAYYCAKFIECTVDHYKCGTSPLQIYDINQLDAMCLATQA